MRKYAVISSLLHICILLLAYFGLLTWKHKELDIMQPVPVEVFQVAEQTQSPKPVQESLKIEDVKETKEEVKPLPKEDPPEEKPKEEPKPEPQPEPKPEAKPEPKPEAKPAPEAEALPKLEEKPKPKPEPKKEEPKKEEPKPKKEEKPKDKPKEKPKEKPKPKQDAPRDFISVLKDLQKKKTKSEGTSKTAQTLNSDGFSGLQGPQVTVSELDIVRRQIEEVWSLPAGVKQIQEMTVPIKIWMNPDRTVRDARVIDTAMLSDSAYNTLAESALRAVLTFKDKPLLLPIGKYNVWKELKITFDPRNVL